MAGRKRNNVLFSKPEEPDFLKRMKAEIGYTEGDSVETKRQRILDDLEDDEDYDEREDEKPQVIVVKNGDLTEEEAEKERLRLEKEEAEKPADLNQRIIFKAKKKDKSELPEENPSKNKDNKKKDKNRAKDKPKKSVLSFNDDDEDEG